MMSLRHATLSLALAVTAAGCADDPCKESAPAVQVRLALGSAVDAARVKELMVEVKAAGRQIKHTFSITNELDDRETSFNVHVGSAGDGGFTVEVLVRRRRRLLDTRCARRRAEASHREHPMLSEVAGGIKPIMRRGASLSSTLIVQ